MSPGPPTERAEVNTGKVTRAGPPAMLGQVTQLENHLTSTAFVPSLTCPPANRKDQDADWNFHQVKTVVIQNIFCTHEYLIKTMEMPPK